MPGLGTSFGRGGATSFQQDMQFADCVLIQGSSLAEAHPVGFRWVMKARERGARVIHVDPRFSRTSAVADTHVPIRAGTDIAFLGGLIRHVLETESYFREYVLRYTNASTIITERFADTEDLGGVFSGFDPETGTYDRSTWMYEGGEIASAAGMREHASQAFDENTGAGLLEGAVQRDETLQHPRCVFQLLRKHYGRYTPEMVERICGIPQDLFHEVAGALVENSGPERTSTLCYALGWTQQAQGVQMIRAGAVLQLLLGNVGRPGGSVMAMRGHAAIQGSSDIPTLYDLLPGYLHMPRAAEGELTLERYVSSGAADRGWWSHFDNYIVSMLKAWFGDAATQENDFGFGHLPKITGNHAHFPTMLRAVDGGLDGFFVMGQNPAVGSQHAGLQRRALARLKWLVVRDLNEIETATFWRDSPEVGSGELRPEDIETEVFLMPAATHVEKEGSFTNTQRLVQWRDKALDPPGDARSELWFMHHLTKRVKAHYAASEEPRDWPIRNLVWDYEEHGPEREPSAEAVLREINGYEVSSGAPVPGFAQLRNDGTTACGVWIYSGVYADGVNQARRREPGDLEREGGWVSPEWAWAWPANRRVLYNRASADPQGRPWSERKKLIWWDEETERWTGYDVPDFPVDKRPDYRAPEDGGKGMDAIGGDEPFIMMGDGRAWLYSPTGLLDGPMPTHYEPVESPVDNALYPGVGANPVAIRWERADNPYHPIGDPRYPYVATTFRLTEHHTAGAMSRTLPWLSELQPEMFAEIGPGLAAERGIEDGGWMTIVTARARDRGAREGHGADAAAGARRAHHPPGRHPLALGVRGDHDRGLGQRPHQPLRRPQRDHRVRQGLHLRRPRRAPPGLAHRAAGRRAPRPRRAEPQPPRGAAQAPPPGAMTTHAPPSEISIRRAGAERLGFFTDTTVCIGCKACEVACKQWNDLPADGGAFRRGGSYDHTGELSANTWRHVRFVELLEPSVIQREEARLALERGEGGGVPHIPAASLADAGGGVTEEEVPDLVRWAEENGREHGEDAPVDVAAAVAAMDGWVFMSDVCKHCTNAGCMDACPTGALIRTEFETVVLQPDVCNGCGYCIPSCPFGVVDRDHDDGRAAKCTLCYDRLQDGLEPACAKACPTDSIQFGPYDELVGLAQRRVATLHARGLEGAYLYGAGDREDEQLAGGLGAFFLLTEPPERYGLPAQAESPIQENVVPATLAAMGAGLTAAAGVAAAFTIPRRVDPSLVLAGVALATTAADAVRRLRRGR